MRIRYQTGNESIYSDTCAPLENAAKKGEITLYGWSNGNYPGLRLPENAVNEICYLGMWNATKQQDWRLDDHYNEGVEFTLLKHGQLEFGVDGEAWVLPPNSLTITRPWQLHHVGDPQIAASRLSWLILDVHVRRPNDVWQWPNWLLMSHTERQRLTRLLSMNENPVWRANQNIVNCFEDLTQLLEKGQPENNITRLKICVNQLLVNILDMLQGQQIAMDAYIISSYRTVKLFLEELPEHVRYEWSLDEMSSQCGLSRTQFSAYCKQITNMSPLQYLRFCRIDQAAKQLSENPDLSITEVAFTCGFNSSQYFATVFQQFKGMSPKQYRDRFKTNEH